MNRFSSKLPNINIKPTGKNKLIKVKRTKSHKVIRGKLRVEIPSAIAKIVV